MGVDIQVAEGDNPDIVLRHSAMCKRDLILSLENEIGLAVRHLPTANEMYVRVKRMFVGSELSQKTKIREELNKIQFKGNYFVFMTQIQAGIAQLRSLNGIFSEKGITMEFLRKLPRSISSITHELKQWIEEQEEDDVIIWNHCHDKVLNYLLDLGLYDASIKEEPTKAFTAHDGKKKHKYRCHHCKEKGHFRRDCPKRKKESKEHLTENQEKKKESWVCTSYFSKNMMNKPTFIVDSGASHHICGDRNLFSELKEIEKGKVLTANGAIDCSLAGKLSLKMESGLEIELKDVLYWPTAPNLLSVVTLTEQGLEVNFKRNHVEIKRGKNLICSLDKVEGLYKLVPQQVGKVCMISAKVWHHRLNHCSIDKLKKVLKDKVSNKADCPGCILGKAQRKPIYSKNKFKKQREILEILVADTVGPYVCSVDKKRGALIVGDVSSGYLWFLPFYRKSDVVPLFVELLRRLERMFKGGVKLVRTDNGTEFKPHK